MLKMSSFKRVSSGILEPCFNYTKTAWVLGQMLALIVLKASPLGFTDPAFGHIFMQFPSHAGEVIPLLSRQKAAPHTYPRSPTPARTHTPSKPPAAALLGSRELG